MKIRTLNIDGSYLLKRSFNGAKDVYTNSFGHIGGLYQFMTMLRKLIKDYLINKVIVFWDGENGGLGRYYIDHAYKANRKSKKWHEKIEMTEAQIKHEKEKDESLLVQKKRIQSYLEELFIRQIEIDEIEADDLIAEYCMRNYNKEEIFIYTNDRDFSQLLDLNISIIFGNIGQAVTKINYIMHFNHYYQNALILKVIVGDTSDNIEGIKGISETTLLKYFPELKYKKLTVRDICKKADEINKERVKNKKKPLKIFENLLNNIDRLKTNYKLINLREPFLNEAAIDELEQLEIPLSPEGRSSKNLYKMMIEDDFLSIFKSTFVNYVEPYYTVIMNEKQMLNEYNKLN